MRGAALLLALVFLVPIAGATPACNCIASGSWDPAAGAVTKVSWGGDTYLGQRARIHSELEPTEVQFITVFWSDGGPRAVMECARWSPDDAEFTPLQKWVDLSDPKDRNCPEKGHNPALPVERFSGEIRLPRMPVWAGEMGDAPECIYVSVKTADGVQSNFPDAWPERPEDCPKLAKLDCGSCGGFFIPATRTPAMLLLLAALALLRR